VDGVALSYAASPSNSTGDNFDSGLVIADISVPGEIIRFRAGSINPINVVTKEVIDMQKDFHFYTIYALARAAGFSPDHSFVIAYSSQHTDDAKYDHALKFENGG